MNPCDYFLWDYLKDRVYCNSGHSFQELQAETEAVTEETAGTCFMTQLIT